MGTPEFPDLGKHCSVDDCKLIDFLPFTCDRCLQVFCLEHRSYQRHNCPKADRGDVTVVICPLCAKGVRLNPDEDANITWEKHVNTDCDPPNYEKATKKKRCPVPRCREVLTFSNTVKCRDCNTVHCLKHRFGPDHNCPGPKKPSDQGLLSGLLNLSRKEEPKQKPNRASATTSKLSSFCDAASRLSNDISQKLQFTSSSSSNEVCPQCGARFSSVASLIEHVEKTHEKSKPNRAKVTIDACPKCSRGFRDPVALVEHIEREHGGTSRA